MCLEEFRKEPATLTLIIINIVVFLMVEFTGLSQDTLHMLDWGAAYTPLIVEKGEVYRLFTSMFLHFGIEHLINNMLVLFVLGQRLEPVTGKIKFFLIYIFGGLGGNMLSLFFDMYAGNASLSAGASGAVFAVMGGMIYVIIRHRGRVADLTVRQMLIMAAFSLYFGFASEGVDNVAHIGGLLSGFLIAVILYHPRKIWKTVP
jgi:rhomboid protease GluP